LFVFVYLDVRVLNTVKFMSHSTFVYYDVPSTSHTPYGVLVTLCKLHVQSANDSVLPCAKEERGKGERRGRGKKKKGEEKKWFKFVTVVR
jgi:hypothetical protein